MCSFALTKILDNCSKEKYEQFYYQKCILCIRHSKELSKQFMGSFPTATVTPASLFALATMYYAAPYLL